jgi:transcriptional regulator with XRE-family HTH domain
MQKPKTNSIMNQNADQCFSEIFVDTEKNDSYWEELAILEFTEALIARLETLSLTKVEWAKKLGTKPSQITRLLAGKNNFTLRTMVKLARSLQCDLASPTLLPQEEPPQTYLTGGITSVIVPFVLPKPTEEPFQPARQQPIARLDEYRTVAA